MGFRLDQPGFVEWPPTVNRQSEITFRIILIPCRLQSYRACRPALDDYALHPSYFALASAFFSRNCHLRRRGPRILPADCLEISPFRSRKFIPHPKRSGSASHRFGGRGINHLVESRLGQPPVGTRPHDLPLQASRISADERIEGDSPVKQRHPRRREESQGSQARDLYFSFLSRIFSLLRGIYLCFLFRYWSLLQRTSCSRTENISSFSSRLNPRLFPRPLFRGSASNDGGRIQSSLPS